VPIGYAWFFGGNAYVLWRLFQRGLTRTQILGLFGVVVVIDALATSTATWLNISGFFGPQPFLWGGVNVWFSFADATGVIVGATVLYVLAPRLRGWRWLWLLVTPTISYGAVLGGVCSPVTLGLHSDWTTAGRWLGGAATIALCCIVAYACSHVTARNPSVELLGARGHGDVRPANPNLNSSVEKSSGSDRLDRTEQRNPDSAVLLAR
jgi:hypothetical protein